jgi:hypothetical protein
MTIIITKPALLIATLLLSGVAFGFDLRCSIGVTCISTQGTKIPAKQVIEMLDRCSEFTENDVGRVMLRLSQQEILKRANGKAMHPLHVAYYAFDQLRSSPLKFDRKSNTEDTNYFEVKRACLELNQDFNNDGKWVK